MSFGKSLQGAIDYMESHLLEKVNYEDVAKEVYMSCYNFHRIFSLMAGMTANEYIRNRRLSLAGQELQLTDSKIIEVAYKFGYETPESFAKAFSRFHGVSPKLAKRKGTQLCLFNPLAIKIILEGGSTMNYRIEETCKQRFIAKVRAFSNEIINEAGNHDIPDFWGECNKEHLVDEIRNMRRDGKKDLYGLCSPTKENEITFDYGIGVIIDEDTNLDNEEAILKKGYRIWEVDSATYVVFKCYGNNGDCISEMWSRFFKEFLPQSDYEQTEDTDYEIYPEEGEPGLFCELWIPIKRVS
ncbi:AraC family transcriptional regulator [Clostridium chromiireducens]|uniref:AraC family transcriptional regulator n=1 Tax=Clostridium chromiireducens TaxID=225345 RepID=A0A399IKB2_9CLOT|nr:AraC family transcriptional regulator [Clostridium chromiireducens]RII32947.1 AraC family transcriptional regulator [Clostridium chromiireducens]